MPDINPAWIALIGTLFGGAGLKLIEAWLSKSKDKDFQGRQIRDELRLEAENLRRQLEANRRIEQELEKEIEDWRSRYYNLRDENMKIRIELSLALAKIKADMAESIKEKAEEIMPETVDDENAV